MNKFEKTIYIENPAIRIYDDHSFCQRFLCRSDWFKDYWQPEWDWDMNPSFNISGEKVNIVFESSCETYIVFESEIFQKLVFDWIQENNFESPEYWEKLAQPILDKLKSDNILLIKEGILELKDWVNSYNQEYVDRSKCSADLSIFGFDYNDFEEGDLWPNPLFDQLLHKYKNELNETDLFNLINALFNENEDYSDCMATYTAITYLLEKRTDAIEQFIVKATLSALVGHEPGHRYFERSLLDRLVDDVFPTFATDSIITLLEGLHSDNLRSNGDNFISLATISLNRNISNQQREKLTNLIEKYSD